MSYRIACTVVGVGMSIREAVVGVSMSIRETCGCGNEYEGKQSDS